MEYNNKMYLFLMFWTFVGVNYYFAGELARATLKESSTEKGTQLATRTTSKSGSVIFSYADYIQSGTKTISGTVSSGATFPPTTTELSGSTRYDQCTDEKFCKKCYSAGAGGVACFSFAWMAIFFAVVLRLLVIYEKHSFVPFTPARYVFVEKTLVWTQFGLYLLGLIAWGGGCMGELAQEPDVVNTLYPTGYGAVILMFAASIAAIVYVSRAIAETSGGATSGGAAVEASKV